jgi:hypothetical protein
MKLPGFTLSMMSKIAGGTAIAVGATAGALYFGSDQTARDAVCHTAEEATVVVGHIGDEIAQAGREIKHQVEGVIGRGRGIPYDCPGCGMG